MQPYITPNSLRALAGLNIHSSLPGIVTSLVAGGGGGGGPEPESSELPVLFADTSGTVTSASITGVVPSVVNSGDFLLMTMSADNFTAVPMASGAAGWNAISNQEEGIPGIIQYWKFAGDGEASTEHVWQLGASSSTIFTMVAVSGVNLTDPIGQVHYEPDEDNKHAEFDPNSTTLVYYGRTVFITAAGPRAIRTVYDNSLALSAWGLDGTQLSTVLGHQNLSGYQHVYKHKVAGTQAHYMGKYPMPNIGLVPADTMYQMASDSTNGVTLVSTRAIGLNKGPLTSVK